MHLFSRNLLNLKAHFAYIISFGLNLKLVGMFLIFVKRRNV
jgi:hypothetical protein